jgi:hypothetical protein
LVEEREEGMADDAQLKRQIKQLLESWQFEVEPLDDDGASLTPDFALRAGEEQYLLEVKQKEDDAALREEEARRLADGETVWRAEPWGRRNRIAGVIRHGVEQLSAHDAPPDIYRLLWLHAGGEDPALYWEQFHGTLYGTANIFQLHGNGGWTCYYFYDSAFYRWRSVLVGAVIADNESAQLCINSYAANAAGLRASRLAKRFGTGICDPVALEEHGSALIADCDVDRADSSRVMQYLQTKYRHGLLTHLDMGKLTAAIAVDARPSGATDNTDAVEQREPDDLGEALDS